MLHIGRDIVKGELLLVRWTGDDRVLLVPVLEDSPDRDARCDQQRYEPVWLLFLC